MPLILPGPNSCRVKQVLLAQAEAEKIRKLGEAEAAVIEAMGKAEAERMKLKAEAYQKYGDAAKMALVLEALPQVRPVPWGGSGRAHRHRLAKYSAAGRDPYNRHGLTWAPGSPQPWLANKSHPSCVGFGEGRRRRERHWMGQVDRVRAPAKLSSHSHPPPPRLLPKSPPP